MQETRGWAEVKGTTGKQAERQMCVLKPDGTITFFKESKDPMMVLQGANEQVASLSIVSGWKVKDVETKNTFNVVLTPTGLKKAKEITMTFSSAGEMVMWYSALNQAIETLSTMVYGVPLQTAVNKQGAPPKTVVAPVEYLRTGNAASTPGLFRESASSQLVQQAKETFDKGLVPIFTEPHVAANALKQYLMQLPEPLLTHILYQDFLDAARDRSEEKFQSTIAKLPPANFETLRFLIDFLSYVATKSDVNNMTSSNLAIVFGPTILRSAAQQTYDCTDAVNAVCRALIDGADTYFPPPPPPPEKEQQEEKHAAGEVVTAHVQSSLASRLKALNAKSKAGPQPASKSTKPIPAVAQKPIVAAAPAAPKPAAAAPKPVAAAVVPKPAAATPVSTAANVTAALPTAAMPAPASPQQRTRAPSDPATAAAKPLQRLQRVRTPPAANRTPAAAKPQSELWGALNKDVAT
eukprot:TRINITY_DN5081_c0_g1_i1.p1 TRINITY_DN5081_c0_g1~~TRINITY_DN5081_c0_g1_i1.p1  ORF type:complete len:465 (-),score=153.43 TRINITY_DN5081_c0_g1_i1:78-1472(-)